MTGRYLVIIIILINLFIEGSLISAQALLSLRTLFGAIRIIHVGGWPLQLGHGRVTYTRQEVDTFGEETFRYKLVPCRASNQRRTTSWSVNID